MTSSFFSNPAETIRKLRDVEVDQDQLREYLFRAARDAGDLDDELVRMYERGDLGEFGEEYDSGAVSARELRDLASREDFLYSIPYQGYRIDPDNEELGAFRLAAENPKIYQHLLQNENFQLGSSIEDVRQGLYDAFRRGDIDREDLELLNRAGRSDFLSQENFDADSTELVGETLRNLTGTDADYEGVMPRVADALEIIDEVTEPVTRTVRNYESARTAAQMRGLGNPFDTRLTSNTSPLRQTGATQLGLPLVPENPTLNRILTARDYPERFEDLRADLGELNRVVGGRRNTNPYEVNPEDAITNRILPEVARILSPSQLNRVVRQELTGNDQALRERNALYNVNRDLDIAMREQDFMRRTLERRPTEIVPFFREDASGTESIPGLSLQLIESVDEAKKAAESKDLKRVQDFLEKYPEVGPYLQAPISNTPARVERDMSKLANYVDTEQQISKPEDRLALFQRMEKELGVPYERLSELEQSYTSGDPSKQKEVIDYINRLGFGKELSDISSPALSTRTPVVGGGGYSSDSEEALALRKRINQRATDFAELTRQLSPEGQKLLQARRDTPIRSQETYSYDPETGEVRVDPFGEYGVELSRGYNRADFVIDNPLSGVSGTPSLNTLRFLADNPVTGQSHIAFMTKTPEEDYSHGAKDIPKPVFDRIERFVKENSMSGMRPGTLISNHPLDTYDIANRLTEQGISPKESSTLRREQSFIGSTPNRRAAAYRAGGFGPLTSVGEQYAYVNAEGNIVPLQPYKPAKSLAGAVSVKPAEVRGPLVRAPQAEVIQSREPLTSKAYYSLDPVAAATRGAGELIQGLRRTPAAMLPGAADLIPSPEAIQTGYSQGPAAMATQMGREFVQSLPAAAAASTVLATPAAAPLAPGIGAGLVGTAAARALNEVVRQETGEGIVPKLRQFIGTQQRTGAAAPARVGAKPLVAQIRPLSATQRQEMTRQQNRNEVQRRIDLARERFNPRRGEFGLSELLFGR